MVVGLGPHATLKRGFAIARDHEGRRVTSREAAVGLPAFQVQFHDELLPVTKREHGGDDG
jgi:exonuclease VII large subunit